MEGSENNPEEFAEYLESTFDIQKSSSDNLKGPNLENRGNQFEKVEGGNIEICADVDDGNQQSSSFEFHRNYLKCQYDEETHEQGFLKESASGKKCVDKWNEDVKKEMDLNCSGGNNTDLIESPGCHPSLRECKAKGLVDSDSTEKDPELFVTFEKQAESNIDTSEKSALNGILEKGSEECNIKECTESENTVEKCSEVSSFQNKLKEVVKKKRKRDKSSSPRKKRPKPNFLEIQMVKHPLLPPCQCNKRKCGDNFSFEMRSHIHDKFWIMNMYERREWINEHLLYLKPKSRTNHPVSTLHESHRKFFLPNQSEKIEVCRRMFFSTLGFKDEAKFLQNPKFLNKKGMLSRTRKRKCVMSRKHLSAVEKYCKELAGQHGTTEKPETSTQVIIPSGFSLRDMYNDFCAKNSTTSFGYHRFRQILELLLRGEKIEDSQFADLKEDDDADDDDFVNEDVKVFKKNVSKSNKLKEKKTIFDNTSTIKNKKHSQKKTTQNLSRNKKNKTILKLPLFSSFTNTTLNKRKRKEAFPNSLTNKRYNFRESISVLTSYCVDDLMESAMEPEIETYEDLINDVQAPDVETDNVHTTLESKPEVRKDKKVKDKKSKRKAKKYFDKKKKKKPWKKKQKTALREAQISYTESRRKTGMNHPVLSPCKCNFRKCSERITENQRQIIHDDFWTNSTKNEKKEWIQKYILHCKPRSRSNFIKFPRKHLSKKYFFPNEEGKMVSVCRVFFMRTLGYHSNMTIESMDMSDSGLDLLTVPEYLLNEKAKKDADENNKKSIDADSEKTPEKNDENKASQSSRVRKELSSETGNMEDKIICKKELLNSNLDEGDTEEVLQGEQSTDKDVIYFTPEIEKQELEKAVSRSVRRRRPLSLRNSKEYHPMGEPCHCTKKCPDRVSQDRRVEIYEQYWSLITYNQRKQWILENIKREVPKRRTVLSGPVRKKETRKCYLPSSDGTKIEVCRTFFLSTLGFKWDKMIDTICKTTPQDSKYVRADQRGKRAPVHKLPDDVSNCMTEYLESILKTIPFIPPQPRDPLKSGNKKSKKSKNATAPVPSGLTIKTLFADYKAKHPNQKVSYASFRKVHCQVRDIIRSQNPGFQDIEELDKADSSAPQNQETHYHSDMSASPGSDNDFTYDSNNLPPDPRRMNNHSTTIPPLQSCMYNEQPHLLNLSSHHPDIMSKHGNNPNESNRLGSSTGSTSSKFLKAQQDFHLHLPFSTYDKVSTKGHGSMYQLPGHSSTNIMAPYSSSQTNPLDPFYMSSTTQGVSNPIAYSNLHFPTDLIGHHPHLPPHHHHHHPAHHHPHLYQSTLPYRDHHNRFPGGVLPQALKDHDPNNHFYNSQMEFGLDHHHPGPDNNMYPFKDALNYPTFTTEAVTNHSPVQNQITNQHSLFPPTSGNSSSNQEHSTNSFVENSIVNSSSSIKVPIKEHLDFINEGTSEQFTSNNMKNFHDEIVPKEKKKKSSRSRKKNDGTVTPKVKRVRKVRPLSNRNSKEHHPMLPACTCGKKCFEKISQEQREAIYEAFWDLGSYNNRKQWIAEHMKREDPKRRTNLEAPVMRKKETRRFTVPNASDVNIEVCRLFFLHTLGLKWDKIIGTICKTTARDEHVVPPDMRGKKPPAHKLNDEVSQSVESYARALVEAAKPEYLENLQHPNNPKKFSLDTFIPYGLTMKNLHQDYKAKHASHKVSYESFRKIFRQIRKEVLDPDSVDVEEKREDAAVTNSDKPESVQVQGTINAATGHIDTVEDTAD